jgi:hypothetical protein
MLREKTRDDLGLAITMLDSDRLRQWAEKLDTHGSDISHWADRRFVSEQLRAVAGRIEATVRLAYRPTAKSKPAIQRKRRRTILEKKREKEK